MVQGIRLCTPNSGGPSFLPGQGTRFYMLHSQINIVRVVYNILKKKHTKLLLLCRRCWMCEGVMISFRCFYVVCIWSYVIIHSVVSDSLWPPWIIACQAPLCTGILQAGILKWVAMLCSRGSSEARDWTQDPPRCRQILYHLSHQGSPLLTLIASVIKMIVKKCMVVNILYHPHGFTQQHVVW